MEHIRPPQDLPGVVVTDGERAYGSRLENRVEIAYAP
jgi:hypothetical protein